MIIGISAFANEKPFADINELFFNNNLTLENLECEKGNTENGCLSLGRERLCYIEDGEEKKCNTTNCPIYILFYELTKSVTEEENDNEQQRKEIISDLRVFLKEFIGEDKAKDLIGGKSKNKCEDICDNLYDLAKKYINPFERYNKVHDKNYYKYHEICLNAYNKLCIDTYKLLYYTSALMKACDYDETKCVRMECNKITAFIWCYAITNPGVNALRTPVYAEMLNIVSGTPVTFNDFLFNTQQVQNAINNYVFSNNRSITKSLLTWWAFQNPEQELIPLETVLEIEHIYARNRQAKEHSLANPRNIELLGNKSLLEKRINIRASDYRFCDKQKYYIGFENSRKQMKEGTKIKELIDIASSHTDFTETDIVQRNAKIIAGFIDYLRENDLLCYD